MPQPTIGRTVIYTLTESDAEQINRRRPDGPRGADGSGSVVHVVHVGNHASAGDTYPATIVRCFGGPNVNLQVQLDGNDLYWATSRPEGDQPGQWAWPTRVES